MQKELRNLEEQFQKDLQEANTKDALEALSIKYLGRKSNLNQLFSKIPTLDKKEKGVWGKTLNVVKDKITTLISEKLKGIEFSEEKIDLTFPATPLEKGSRHVLSIVSQEICLIFEKLGFTIAEGSEIEDEWHNFSALNIPLEHPSRDAFDTFYLDIPCLPADRPEKGKDKYLLRSHTSPSQIRVMEKNRPPLAIISPGRVYRPDQVDASHSFMFHQVEGFAVSRDINFSHLKGVLLHFAKEFFSSDVNLRFRPHFFPFTEPSAEVDISCFACTAHPPTPRLRRTSSVQRIAQKCSVCKGKGWLEILGCGMIHPKVLEACHINSKKYQGFAFGMGVERSAMLKYGIDDIRLFFENDIRFLEQF
ncbi:MAG: phenylalanine--tRNA ligase subunit alpha [Candidatus Omnitrophota bacterium]|nr:phenylalanine--tRNA ligase subunit alpha [Candidatus Omnitrophota bacterium]